MMTLGLQPRFRATDVHTEPQLETRDTEGQDKEDTHIIWRKPWVTQRDVIHHEGHVNWGHSPRMTEDGMDKHQLVCHPKCNQSAWVNDTRGPV